MRLASLILRGLAVCLLSASCTANADETSFRKEMIARLERNSPDTQYREGDEALVVTYGARNDEPAIINLHRIYSFCKNAPEPDCEAIKAEFVERVGREPDPVTSGSLRIIVRDAEYVAYLEKLESDWGELTAVRQKIGEDLFAILVSDSAENIALVGDKGLKAMDLRNDVAWDIGWRQTLANLPKIPAPDAFTKGGMAFEDEEYLASLAYDLERWQAIADRVGPDFFITLVSDQFVFAGKMPNGEPLDAFRKSVEEDCKLSPRCVSPNIYRLRGGQWVIARATP